MLKRSLLLLVIAALAGIVLLNAACRAQTTAPARNSTTTATSSKLATATASVPAGVQRVHVFVSGGVQGVGYRAFTESKAGEIGGLTGWVKNLADGRVEAVIEGPPDKIAALLDQMRKGPERSRVDKLQSSREPPTGEFGRFTTRY